MNYQRQLAAALYAVTLPSCDLTKKERKAQVAKMLRRWGRRSADVDHHSAGVMALGDSEADRATIVEVEHSVSIHSMTVRLISGELPLGQFRGWPSAEFLFEDLSDTYRTCLVTRHEHGKLNPTGLPDGVADSEFGVVGSPTHGYNWARYRELDLDVFSIVDQEWIVPSKRSDSISRRP